MNIPKITLVRADDWQAVYFDDRLITHSHSTDWPWVLENDLKLDVEVIWAQDQADNQGEFPMHLGEVMPDDS